MQTGLPSDAALARRLHASSHPPCPHDLPRGLRPLAACGQGLEVLINDQAAGLQQRQCSWLPSGTLIRDVVKAKGIPGLRKGAADDCQASPSRVVGSALRLGHCSLRESWRWEGHATPASSVTRCCWRRTAWAPPASSPHGGTGTDPMLLSPPELIGLPAQPAQSSRDWESSHTPGELHPSVLLFQAFCRVRGTQQHQLPSAHAAAGNTHPVHECLHPRTCVGSQDRTPRTSEPAGWAFPRR